MSTNAILILAIPLLCLAIGFVMLVVWFAQTMVVQGNKEEAWSTFAQQIKGVYRPRSLGVSDQVLASHCDWPIHLDTYVAGVKGAAVEYTRLRAFYAVRVPFELVVTSDPYEPDHTVTSNLQAIPNPMIDIEVSLMTSNPDSARSFLAADNVRLKFTSVQPINLQIRRRRHWRDTGVSHSIYEVHLQMPKVITNIDCLVSMYALVVACLDQLHLLGYAHHSFADGAVNSPTVVKSPS